jgi:cytochrome c-type biogenesis protein CcmF
MGLGQLGFASVLLAVGLAGYSIVAGLLGLYRRDGRLLGSARLGAVALFLALTTAVAVMETALVSDDFSVKYVADTSSIFSPLWVKIVTLWAALEGSILLWAWILSGYTALLALVAPNSPLRPWALVVMVTVQLFFVGVVAFVANPFITLPVPPSDGPGPNPLLQNHWMMAVHPVLTYLGVVGLTVPFAYAIAALITRRPGSEWMRETRTWTMAGWGLLTAAIVAGGWWSYEVLGWGGYWAWDPVENVILLPWLTATAFIHSVQVQERRRMLKAWNVFLIVLTFNLSILATFLIRSGVLSSVHAFGDGPVGPVFLGFFLFVTLVAFGLVAIRWDQLRDQAELDSPVSREGGFLLNNVLFTAIAFAVLLGTLFPLIVEAFTGDKVTVGTPFFNRTTVPLWLALLALMGVGPLLPWRRAAHQTLLGNLRWLAGATLAAGVIGYLIGVREPYPLITVALAGLNLASLALLLGGSVRARTVATGRGAFGVFRDYALESRRRFGSMIVHFGIVVMALGLAASGGYRVDTQFRLDMGQPVSFQGYQLTLERIFRENLPQRTGQVAAVRVTRGGRTLATLEPRINRFRNSDQSVPSPGVLYRPLEDVYLTLSLVDEAGQSVVLRAVRSPLVTWIWFGALIVLLGTSYALSPQRRPLPARRQEALAR